MQSTSPSLTSDREFIPWVQQQNISLAFTTYQTNWLAFIGVNPETGGIYAFQRQFNRAMGLYCTPDRLYLSSKYQLWQLDNVLQPGQFYQGRDRLFIPRIAYTTGDIDVHDVAVTETGELIFISTLLNCLATTSDRHSCKPLWKPPFISQIINEDRCHLNGLAMVDGQPGYVTACSRSDVVDGWRDRRKDGGVAIDIASNEIILTGLSMPHSPRFYQGKLWLLNSGTGEFGYVDLDLGKFEPITFCPGYARGLAFWQDYAIVGLSKPRSGDGTFSGLLLDDRLKEKDADARCGLLVIDLKTGTIVHWVRIEGTITELYDVGVLPGTQKPMALGFQTQEIEQLISLEPLSEINLVTGDKKGGDQKGDRVINERLSGIGRKTSEKGAIAMSTLGRNGRFGNQLFQYAFLKLYAKQNDLRVETPKWIGQTLFGHRDPMISRHYPEVREISNKLSNARIPQAKKTFQNVDFWGFFQYHTSYYKPERDYWRSLFQPVPEIRTCMEVAIARLRSRGKTIVGLHLRRGDYGRKYFFVAPSQWYLDWLKQIWHTLENPVLFIASGELETVIKDFAAYHPITYKDLGVTLPEAEFYPDFYILSHCDRVAISNSSFSFVACMMNEQATQFVRPHLPSQKLISFDPWDSEVIFLDIPTKDQEDQQIEVENNSDRAIPPTPLNQVCYKIGVTEQPSTSQDLSQIIAESFPTLNVLLFFQGPRDYYRPILFSHNEVFCSPDCQTTIEGDRILTIKTPVGEFDAAKIVSQLPSAQKPDLIMVKADSTRRVMPKNLQAIDCPKVLFCADTHHLEKPIQSLLDYAATENFDFYLFSFDRHHGHYFQESGLKNLFWIPVVDIYPRQQPPRTSHKYPLSFVGQAGKFHPYRKYILDLVRQWQFPLNQQQLPHNKAAEVYADSLINLNISLNGDLNLRTFEVLASGGFLLTDKLSPQAGLDLLFEDGKHLVYYTDEADLREKINYFLNHPQAAQAIAANGCKAFWNNHRPEQNVRRLMDYLNGKGIDPIFQIESEPRNVYLTKSEGEAFVTEVMEARKYFGTNALPLHRHGIQKQNALKHRISIYEYLQEMHRTTPKIKGLFWDSIDEKIVADAVDLPRLQVHLLQENGRDYELFERCQITEQISFITPAQLNGNINPWDLVIINGQELQKIGVEAFLNQLNLKLLILTDIKVNPELEQSLQTAGLVKQSQQPLVYGWRGKTSLDKQNNIELLLNQALTYQQQGQFAQAIPLYQQVLTAEPDNLLLLTNYGKALQKVNRHQEAIDILRRAIQLNPERAQLYFYLSQSLKVQGDMEAAAECLQKAIQLQPDFWGAYNNLGTILQQQGNLAEAAQCYEKALEYNHNFAQAHSNLASIWQLQGDLERAKAGLIRALQLEPNYVPALLNLAYIYKQQGRLPGAIDCYQQVLAQEPRPEAYYNLGEILDYQGNIAGALACYQKVQELDPKNYNIEGAIAFTRLKICDWEDYESRTAEFIHSVQKYLNQETAYSPSPLALSSFPVPLALHRQFAESLSRATVAKMAKIKAGCNFAYPPNTDKLKIGYISPDFREHAVGKILKDMFSYCDRTRFEVYAYSTVDYNDAITETIRNGCDYFVNISAMTAETAARKINADGIHILIDLAGRTIGNGEEILALQPAQIQAHFLGYPDTMGADFIQYAIADSKLITPEIAQTYTEEIIYLPHAFFSSPMEIFERMMTRAEFGIPEDAFVFCCFNSHYKITPDLFDLWMRILAQVSNSVLWLTGGSEILIANLRREAAKRGIDGNRLFFTEKLPNSEYLARYRLADLFLDTFIYNGGSTAISALYAGCPVLTRSGNTNASRMGASICAAAKLNSLICSSSQEYEKQAIYLANHPRSLGYYRRHLSKNRDQLPLFNVRGFVQTLENALWQMWETYTKAK
ncbi:TIGR03032 family protein [Planktothricoides sp. SR001]|uniref:TIGR03032 family protein n=1 Tax=Planktothricoides sp. SR001 TaxID=1705388 RepID=UPI0009EA80FE|nr:TIGR03032 family protein [Planktothricoides sp. SR001]